MRIQHIASLLLCLAYSIQARSLTGDRSLFSSEAEQVNHIYALIGGAPLASLGALPASPLEALAGSVPQVMDSVKSFQARSKASSGCRKLSPGRTLKLASEQDGFPLSALSPGMWPSDASYFDQGDPMLRTETLAPAVARAQMIERLHLGGPILQQMERPAPELPLLNEAPAGAPAAQGGLDFTEEAMQNSDQPCERLPINIFAALARDGYVTK